MATRHFRDRIPDPDGAQDDSADAELLIPDTDVIEAMREAYKMVRANSAAVEAIARGILDQGDFSHLGGRFAIGAVIRFIAI